MTREPRADGEAAPPARALDTVPQTEPPDRRRPNVFGELPTVLGAGPMFRRALAGYDRFQVDTYVQWAEDELAAADRERDRLLARHLGTQAALYEARELLSHSPGGAEFLGASRRVGSMLASAADAAEGMRAEAEAARRAASAEAADVAARAERVLADARAAAGRMVAAAATQVEEMTAAARRTVAEAEQATRIAHAEAAERLEAVRAIEQRSARQAEQIRRRAVEEALAARQAARDEIVRMLGTGREERRRADAEAASARQRLDRDATARRASLLADVEELRLRRAVLRAENDRAADPVDASTGAAHPRLRGYRTWIQSRLHAHP